jgi:hypothetical protein
MFPGKLQTSMYILLYLNKL